MKHSIFILLPGICMLPWNSKITFDKKETFPHIFPSAYKGEQKPFQVGQQDKKTGPGKMLAAEFKSQEFCRAEMEDFNFDARFSIISATVYFSGKNFGNVERGFLTSSSLKPIRGLMDRSAAGTMVVFDDIKVIGPDKEVRTIQGVSYLLY